MLYFCLIYQCMIAMAILLYFGPQLIGYAEKQGEFKGTYAGIFSNRFACYGSITNKIITWKDWTFNNVRYSNEFSVNPFFKLKFSQRLEFYYIYFELGFTYKSYTLLSKCYRIIIEFIIRTFKYTADVFGFLLK